MLPAILLAAILGIPDIPARYHGTCAGQFWSGGCRSEDLPDERFINRWHYLIQSKDFRPPFEPFERVYLPVRVGVASGRVFVEAKPWVHFSVTSIDDTVRHFCERHEGAEETIWQYVTIRRANASAWEILIEQPVGDLPISLPLH